MKSKLLNLKFNKNFKFHPDLIGTNFREGFTLIELLVVMAIIGVLASLIFLNVGSSLGKARDAQRKNDLNAIQTALELYHSDNGKYPPTTSGWVMSTNPTSPWIPGLGPSYIKTMPLDPKNSCTSHPAIDSNCFAYAYYSQQWNNALGTCQLSGADDGYILTTRLEQYQGSNLSQTKLYHPDGTLCGVWTGNLLDGLNNRVNGLYTVSNP